MTDDAGAAAEAKSSAGQSKIAAVSSLFRFSRQTRAVLSIFAFAIVTFVLIAGLDWRLALLALVAGFTAAVAIEPDNDDLGGQSPGLAHAPGGVADDATLRMFVSHVPDPCVILGHDARVLFANEAAHAAVGPMPSDGPITFALRAPQVSEAVDSVLAGGEAVVVTYFEKVPVDRWFEAHIAMIEGRAGPTSPKRRGGKVMVLLKDLTEAQRVERMRADFIANASHELRTPLASLVGFIETLQGPARDDHEARERFLEIMAQQSGRMARLINDLMSLSRIELKAHVRPDTVVDIVPVVREVADSMQPIAADHDVEIAVDMPEPQLSVLGDRDELTQVIQNLVENAIKYGHTGKRVDISAERESNGGAGGRIRVAVRDFGPGIPSEHLPRLTERFYRVDVETSRQQGGTGLGLAIVKHILNRHRGALSIDSKPGQGATFAISLDAIE